MNFVMARTGIGLRAGGGVRTKPLSFVPGTAMRYSASLSAATRKHGQLTAQLKSGYSAYGFMLMLLVACFCIGLLTTRALLLLGMENMLLRYPLMLLVSYSTFFLGIRIWLAHAGFLSLNGAADGNTGTFGLGSTGDASAPDFHGGGGQFAGGGASASFGGLSVSADSVDAGAADGDGGVDGAEGLLILIALAVLAAVVFSFALYMVYLAPTLLADAAFAGAMSGSLHKASRRISSRDWAGSVWRDTRVPFLLVMLGTLLVAAICHFHEPEIFTIGELLK
jgi:hypothetical protein